VRIETFFTVEEVDPAVMQEATAVVIDVVRATTSMVEALAGGARGIFPVASTEEAVKLAHSLGRDDTLLAGERKGVRIEGFHLGNSPAEFHEDLVYDKRLVMSTTNGTRAFGATTGAARVFACAFTNLSAVAATVSGDGGPVVVLCAGRQGRFALEDALCAGHLVRRVLAEVDDSPSLNDASRAAMLLADGTRPERGVLEDTTAGRALAAIGLAEDLEICAELDRHDVVPVMRDGELVITRIGSNG